MLYDCTGCGREHMGDRPLDWDSLAFEIPVVTQAAVGSPRTTQRVVVFHFCLCCEPIRQRMIGKLKQSSDSRPTR